MKVLQDRQKDSNYYRLTGKVHRQNVRVFKPASCTKKISRMHGSREHFKQQILSVKNFTVKGSQLT